MQAHSKTGLTFNHSVGIDQLWVPIILSGTESGPPTNPANYSTRTEILGFISNNPGIYLRGVSEEMGLALGDVQYHLGILVRDGEIVDRRDGRYRRFFESGRYSETEQRVISLLRQGTTGRILLKLAGEQSATHMELAAMLGMTSQAVTWQMTRLRSMGIVELTSMTSGRAYQLARGVREFVEQCLQAGRLCVPQTVRARERATPPRTQAEELFR